MDFNKKYIKTEWIYKGKENPDRVVIIQNIIKRGTQYIVTYREKPMCTCKTIKSFFTYVMPFKTFLSMYIRKQNSNTTYQTNTDKYSKKNKDFIIHQFIETLEIKDLHILLEICNGLKLILKYIDDIAKNIDPDTISKTERRQKSKDIIQILKSMQSLISQGLQQNRVNTVFKEGYIDTLNDLFS